MDKNNVGGLDFNKWFNYQDQNLSNVNNSPDDVKSLNDEKLSKFLGKDISTGTLSKNEIKEYTKSLSTEQKKWIKANSANFSTNWLMAYVDNWSRWKDPFASWTWMFETVGQPMPQSTKNTLIWVGSTLGWLWILEWGWALLERSWAKQFEKYVRPTKKDVTRGIKDIGYATTYDDVSMAISKQEKKLGKLMAKGASAEEIATEQAVLDQLKKSWERYNPRQQKSTVDWAMENNIAWTEEKMAGKAWGKTRSNWITEVEPAMVRSEFRIKPSNIIRQLTREDFGVTDEVWETQYKPELEKIAEFYDDAPDKSLLELQEWRNQIDESKKFAESGIEAKWPRQNIDDHISRKIWDTIWEQLEKENPWKWYKQKVADYGLWKDFYETHSKKAISEITAAADKEPPSLWKRFEKKIADVYDKITGTNNMNRKTKMANLKMKVWEAIRPSTWYNAAKTAISSVKKDPKVLLKVAKKWLNAINPADLIMPNGKEFLNNIQNDEYLKSWVERNWGDDITEEEWMSILDDSSNLSKLEDKWWTPEWIEILLSTIE